MEDNSGSESGNPVSRRRVMKAGAVSAVGVGLFSGVASATNPKQINFCGCSQVCVDRDDETDGGTFRVIRAYEEEGEWVFETTAFAPDDSDEEDNSFCFDVEGTDPEEKIIGVKKGSLEPVGLEEDENELYVYGNPNQCAQKALDELFSRYVDENDNTIFDLVNGSVSGNDPEPVFGTGFDDPVPDPDDTVDIIRGQCGKPGREPNPGPDVPQGPQGPPGPE